MKKEFSKTANIITCSLFLVILFGLAIAFVVIPDKDYSANENRNLQTFPEFSWERLLDGSFSSEINEYFADQFPLRDGFVSLKAISELALLKGENDGVLLGENGTLAVRAFSMFKDRLTRTDNLDLYYSDGVQRQIEMLNKYISTATVPVDVIIPPRVVDVAGDSFRYPSDISVSLQKELDRIDQNAYIPLNGLLMEKYSAGEYVYYRTDHHWTTLGAYYAYEEIMRSFGMENEIIPMDKFNKTTVTEEFYGTTWSKGGFRFVGPDSMEFWYLGNESEFTTSIGSKSFEGFYDMSYLEGKDKYSAFISGTNDITTVTNTTGKDRPVLLMPKDSFANSLVPFLAQHFDLVLVNMANRLTDISAYTENYSADRVLIVWNTENLVSQGTLGNVK